MRFFDKDLITSDIIPKSTFEEDLRELINRYSLEEGTPDFVLAIYLTSCLNAFHDAIHARENWYNNPRE